MGGYLAAYVISNRGEWERSAMESELRETLKRSLPDYMIPSVFVPLAELPLTPTRKVDRRRLPMLDASADTGLDNFVAPRTSVERVLVGLWQTLLKTERVGIHDDFFRLGGHSLLAAQALSWLRRVFRQERCVSIR